MPYLSPLRSPFVIAAGYAVAGLLWIVFSDMLLSRFTEGSDGLVFYAQLKGIAFILATAAILYFLVKKHYEMIMERQNDLNLLFSQGNLGLIKLTTDGTIEFISQGICKALGYKQRELIGALIQDVTHPNDLEQDQKMVEGLENAEYTNYHFEKRYLKKDSNDFIWVELNGTVQRKHGKVVRYITSVQNVMPIVEGRRKAQIEVREKRALINSTKDIIWSVDDEARLVNFNDAFAKLIQSLNGNNVQRGDFGIIERTDDVDKRKRWKAYYQKAGSHGSYAVVESVESNKQLRQFEITFNPIIEKETVIGVSCFGRDVTELMNTQNELKSALSRLEESTQFTQLALDRLPIGVAVNTIDAGELTFVNKEFLHIYGWNKEEIKDVNSFFEKVYPHREYREAIQKRIMEDIGSGDPNRMQWNEIQITTSNGEERFVDAKNIPVFDQNLMISTVVDVTERYQHIKTIESQNERLKLIAWKQSHEVRAPLTKIMALSNLIRSDIDEGNEVNDLLDKLDTATKEFDLMVREISGLS